MQISGTVRSRWPGRIAIFTHVAAITLLALLIFVGTDILRSGASGVAQIAGVSTDKTGGGMVAVDSDGRITYRSKVVAGRDLFVSLKRELGSSGRTVLTISADSRADSAVIAQIMAAAEQAGAKHVRLSIVQD